MVNLRTLKSKEQKRILEQLEEQYGCDASFLKSYVFLYQEKKEKYFIVRKEVYELPLDELNVQSLGLYFCSWNGALRLSIEGSQLVGSRATRRVLELSDEEFHDWMRGRDLEKEVGERGFLILKHGSDFCGAGKPVERRGITHLKNYVPKSRYVRSE